MTKIKKDDVQKATDELRAKRRLILKAGAAIAPLAVTLHGGVAFAQVTSAGLCVDNLTQTLQIPKYKARPNGFVQNGQTEPFNPSPTAFTGRGVETHWDYVINEQIAGQTCLQSFDQSGESRSQFFS